ncbi:hypothetical protein QUB75_04945 [Microcoleus sp. K1-B6]|uniref:hypothetical protein n=1 Tax=unclassified Microcoleus TaxID=2642155 RepID=UPI002FD63B57
MSWFNLVFGITSIASHPTYNSYNSTELETEIVAEETKQESYTESYGIKILNPVPFADDFEAKVIEALGLLDRYCPDYFALLKQYTYPITSATSSGAAHWKNEIQIAQGTFRHEVEWLASIFVHENHHIMRRSVGDKFVNNSTEEELNCIEQQIRCLKQLNVPHQWIDSLARETGEHYLQEITW